MALGDYTADRRLYLNARGEVVEDKSPDAVTLLVAEGGTVPAARAKELGLVSEEQKQQAEPAAPRTTYVVGGAGPDDPKTFYDDGTPNTPAGNEGYSDVQSPKAADREKHLANTQQLRVTESSAPAMDESGMQRAEVMPSGRNNPRAGGSVDVPASQDKNQDLGDDASMSGEEELRRKGMQSGDDGQKSEAPAEDKAQAAPDTKGNRGPRGGRGASGK